MTAVLYSTLGLYAFMNLPCGPTVPPTMMLRTATSIKRLYQYPMLLDVNVLTAVVLLFVSSVDLLEPTLRGCCTHMNRQSRTGINTHTHMHRRACTVRCKYPEPRRTPNPSRQLRHQNPPHVPPHQYRLPGAPINQHPPTPLPC